MPNFCLQCAFFQCDVTKTIRIALKTPIIFTDISPKTTKFSKNLPIFFCTYVPCAEQISLHRPKWDHVWYSLSLAILKKAWPSPRGWILSGRELTRGRGVGRGGGFVVVVRTSAVTSGGVSWLISKMGTKSGEMRRSCRMDGSDLTVSIFGSENCAFFFRLIILCFEFLVSLTRGGRDPIKLVFTESDIA